MYVMWTALDFSPSFSLHLQKSINNIDTLYLAPKQILNEVEMGPNLFFILLTVHLVKSNSR